MVVAQLRATLFDLFNSEYWLEIYLITKQGQKICLRSYFYGFSLPSSADNFKHILQFRGSNWEFLAQNGHLEVIFNS